MNLFEAFKGLNSLNEETFDTTPEGLQDLSDFIDDDVIDDIVVGIIDPTMTMDELDVGEDDPQSHVGQIIVNCATCNSLIYKDADDIIPDENSELVNIEEECPLCLATNGFELVGKIEPIATADIEEEEDTPKEDALDAIEDAEDKVEEEDEPIEESVSSTIVEMLKSRKTKVLAEDVETVVVETEDDTTIVDIEENGDVTVSVESDDEEVIEEPVIEDEVVVEPEEEFFEEALTEEVLDEAIPKDLANALRSDRSQSIGKHRSNSPDYQNREYTPIDIETAMKMRREGRAGEIEMVIGDNDHATFQTDGSVWENTSDVRNSFGSLAKAASSIYVVSGDDKVAQEKRKARRDANSLKNFNKDRYYGSKIDTEFIDQGSGEHKKPSAQALKRVETAKETVKQYEDRLAQLEASYESGDVSRNEYNTKKEQLLKDIESSKNWVDHTTRELPSNKADEKRYEAQAKAMGSSRARYQDIKKNPAERDVENATQDIEKYKSAAVDKVAEKRKEIERLQREIEKLESDPQSDMMTSIASSRLETAEAELEKQKADLEKIKKGQYVPESLDAERISEWFQNFDAAKGVAISEEVEETLTEDVENVEIETEDDVTTVEIKDDGGVEIETSPKDEGEELEAGTEVIAPLTDDELEVLESPTLEMDDIVIEDEDDMNIEDEVFDEFDEESFDELGESYLKEVYENVESFKTTEVSKDANNLIIEGVIKFASGNEKKTSFLFESVKTEKGKIRLVGENTQITPSKKSFRVHGSINEGKFISESFRYRYDQEDDKIFGVCKRG